MGNLTIGRRRFLQSLGISAATVPFVVGLDSLYVHAQVPVVPKKRFLFMYSPNGMLYYNWRLRLHAQQTDISDGAALAHTALELADSHGRVHVVTPEVAALHSGHGNVMPQSLHGGPGRAGGGEELGGLRALNFYHRRAAVQAAPGVLQQIL